MIPETPRLEQRLVGPNRCRDPRRPDCGFRNADCGPVLRSELLRRVVLLAARDSLIALFRFIRNPSRRAGTFPNRFAEVAPGRAGSAKANLRILRNGFVWRRRFLGGPSGRFGVPQPSRTPNSLCKRRKVSEFSDLKQTIACPSKYILSPSPDYAAAPRNLREPWYIQAGSSMNQVWRVSAAPYNGRGTTNAESACRQAGAEQGMSNVEVIRLRPRLASSQRYDGASRRDRQQRPVCPP